LSEGRVAHVDLVLAGGRNLVVMDFDSDSHLLHFEDHLATDVLECVVWWDREVAFLITRLVPQARLSVGTRIPLPFDCVDVVVALVLVLVVADVVEYEKLEFGAPM